MEEVVDAPRGFPQGVSVVSGSDHHPSECGWMPVALETSGRERQGGLWQRIAVLFTRLIGAPGKSPEPLPLRAVPRGLVKHPAAPNVKVAGLNSSAWRTTTGRACAKSVGILAHPFACRQKRHRHGVAMQLSCRNMQFIDLHHSTRCNTITIGIANSVIGVQLLQFIANNWETGHEPESYARRDDRGSAGVLRWIRRRCRRRSQY